MSATTDVQIQQVIPYLYYADGAAAFDFLCAAFGFRERTRVLHGDGQLMHGEIEAGDQLIMLGTPLNEDGRPALDVSGRHGAVMVYVNDVDAHHARAVAAGAIVTQELTDQPYGDRSYSATDPEGQVWFFATHLADSEV